MSNLDTLKAKREQATAIVEQLELMVNSVSKRELHSVVRLKNIQGSDKQYRKIIKSLDNIRSTTDASITKFQADKAKVRNLLNQANRFYEKTFSPLVAKIEDRENGFKARIKEGEVLKKELDKVTQSCIKEYKEIDVSS